MMKQLFTLFIICISYASYSQVETTPQNGDVQHYSVGKKRTESTVTNSESTRVRTIEDVDAEINSINTKLEIVKNDPEEDKIAKEQGWYSMIEDRLDHLYAERNELLERQKEPNKKQVIKRAYFNELPESKQQIILNNPQTYTIED